MIRPNFKGKHKDIFDPIFQRRGSRNSFLNASYFDDLWKGEKMPVNISNKDQLLKLEVALPGLKKSDIHVSIDGNILTIRAGHHEKKKHLSEYVLQEFNTDFKERTFKLEKEVAKEQVNAKYKNGILTLTFIDVPESEESVKKVVEVV